MFEYAIGHHIVLEVIGIRGKWLDLGMNQISIRLVGRPSKRGGWRDLLVQAAQGPAGGRRELGYFRIGGVIGEVYNTCRVADPFDEVYNPRATLVEYEASLEFNHIHRRWLLDGTPRPPRGGRE